MIYIFFFPSDMEIGETNEKYSDEFHAASGLQNTNRNSIHSAVQQLEALLPDLSTSSEAVMLFALRHGASLVLPDETEVEDITLNSAYVDENANIVADVQDAAEPQNAVNASNRDA